MTEEGGDCGYARNDERVTYTGGRMPPLHGLSRIVNL